MSLLFIYNIWHDRFREWCTQAVPTSTVTLCEQGFFYAPVAFASASLTLRAE